MKKKYLGYLGYSGFMIGLNIFAFSLFDKIIKYQEIQFNNNNNNNNSNTNSNNGKK